MKIYPDPELPDLEVTWFDECEAGAEVALTVTGIDTPATQLEMVVPCADAIYRFADVARERFHVEGALRDASGMMSGSAQQEADLRNGLDVSAFLNFMVVENVLVRWVFESGTS